MQRCYKCGRAYVEPHKAGFQDVCEQCGSYLHCCLNCRFYDEYAHNHCAEPQAEYVSDPNGMNHCEYYVFKESVASRNATDFDDTKPSRRRSPDWRNTRKEEGARQRQDPGAGERAQQARQRLEDLFRKSE